MEIKIQEALLEYQKMVDRLIVENLFRLGDPSRLREACEYALVNGGKRFRPALVLLVAKALNCKLDLTLAALAIEYFHTASLIADDLPCMDNDSERRNKPSLHVAFDEATALMASYALISAGYGCLAENAHQLHCFSPSLNSENLCILAIENVSFNTGFQGATGGQFLDITPPNLELATLMEIAHKKTASLFEISFVLGWLYGGGDPKKLDLVKKASAHFGVAFQVADDIGDMKQDQHNGRAVNIATIAGLDKAKEIFHSEIENYRQTLVALRINSPELLALASILD